MQKNLKDNKMMEETFTFQDVLIQPTTFSFIKSRKDVDTSVQLGMRNLKVPVISANMDSVTNSFMTMSMHNNGALGCLHRFCSIEDNVKMYTDSECNPWVSIGLGNNELERAEALVNAGATSLLVDVAWAANIKVVDTVKELLQLFKGNVELFVGNFATKENIEEFNFHLGINVDGYKVGIGGGYACTTRTTTGCGYPTLNSVQDCVYSGYPIIADGGHSETGDICKSLAVGAKAVMLGRMLAGCNESAAESSVNGYQKLYRGSASHSSYLVQGKVSEYRTPEGISTLIPKTGKLKDKLQEISAALRSSMSYVGANNLEEFREKAILIKVTNNGRIESLGGHGNEF